MKQKRQPPGPTSWNPAHSLLQFGKKPLAFLQSLPAYGDISFFQLLFTPCYFLSHPDFIKSLLANQEHYSKDTADFRVFRTVLGNGLLTSQGDFWLQQRRLMSPAFHRKQVERFGAIMIDATEVMLQEWKKRQSESAEPIVLDMWEEMRRLTTKVAGNALFSRDLFSEDLSGPFHVLEQSIIDFFRVPVLLPLWIPLPTHRRLMRAQQHIDHLISKMIEERRLSQRKEPQPDDLLSMLLSARTEEGTPMSNEQVRNEVVSLLFAGHQTTASALNWVFYLLAQHPEIEKRVHREVDSIPAARLPSAEDLSRLPYIRMVIDEALRLWPPAFMVNRFVTEDHHLGGFHIRKGSLIFASPLTMQRDERFWPEPGRFNPDRFTSDQMESRPKYTYFPFGGGPHMCIGNTFALFEIQISVALIVSRYRLVLGDTSPVEPALLPALRPKNLRLKLLPRNSSPGGQEVD